MMQKKQMPFIVKPIKSETKEQFKERLHEIMKPNLNKKRFGINNDDITIEKSRTDNKHKTI